MLRLVDDVALAVACGGDVVAFGVAAIIVAIAVAAVAAVSHVLHTVNLLVFFFSLCFIFLSLSLIYACACFLFVCVLSFVRSRSFFSSLPFLSPLLFRVSPLRVPQMSPLFSDSHFVILFLWFHVSMCSWFMAETFG